MVRLLVSALLLATLLPSPGFAQAVWMSDLIVRDGLYYQKFSRTPYTGEVRGRGVIENGKLERAWIFTDENGQRLSEGLFRDGVREGPWVFFHPNGQMASRGGFKDGRRSGPWTFFDDNGVRDPQRSGVYRAGERVAD